MTNLTNILSKLTALIEKNKAYIVDGSLNRNLLAADARKYDSELLNLLQKDKELKEHFFAATDGGLVFKKDVFLQFIMNKEFLPDSYTKYKIKIGLGAEDGSLLSESGDVVLNWPYKDAILEGGQDKEDQKRSEVFFNEVLAPDQITRLLDDKVFTNWKRYDKDGEHDLDEYKDDDNLIIKGNNLVVLNSLKKRYAGKVKLTYIDPPYNTGNDGFEYNDRFNHATWLTFMKNRLTTAKELLSSEGSIFISIDANELSHLKVLMDEIFGSDNFRNLITIRRSAISGAKVINPGVVNVSEYLLVYSRSRNWKFNRAFARRHRDPRYGTFIENIDASYEDWKFISLGEAFAKSRGSDARTLKRELAEQYDDELDEFVIEKVNQVVQYANLDESSISGKARELKKESKLNPGRVYKLVREGYEPYFVVNGKVILFYKDRVREIDGKLSPSEPVSDIWTDVLPNDLHNEGGVDFRKGKKPEKLISRIIEIATDPNDLVLDYHLGSGTTAAVAHKMGRRYIGIEQMYYGENDPTNRLKNVLSGDDDRGISKAFNWRGGGSFVYANIMNNSNKYRKRVEAAKNDSDYLALLKEATSSSFLSYRVDPKKLNEDEFRKLSAAEKRHLLLELIDNNTLYVNYEDINDPIFKVNEKDKEFNKKLYEKN